MWSTFSIFDAIFCIPLVSSKVKTVALGLRSSSKPSPKGFIKWIGKTPPRPAPPTDPATREQGASLPVPTPAPLRAQYEQVTSVSATSPRPTTQAAPARPRAPGAAWLSSPRAHFPSSKLRPRGGGDAAGARGGARPSG
jgi:hypothetical protein